MIRTMMATVIFLGAATAAHASPFGNWTRTKSGDTVKVYSKGGAMYCQITTGKKKGFEMCHGMKKAGDNTWKGGDMKHPDMPSAMTFNGTVVVSGSSLSIEGCTLFGAACDSETWKKK